MLYTNSDVQEDCVSQKDIKMLRSEEGECFVQTLMYMKTACLSQKDTKM